MNIIGSAVNFGLGPVGKLSSIISLTEKYTNDIKWFGVGDKIDEEIFEKKVFAKTLWSKDKEELREFIKENNIDLAINVLDPDLAILLEELGVKVFYVDSLPFLWTESDLVPFDVTKYFAQKCVNMNDRANAIMSKVKNLVWVDPISPEVLDEKTDDKYEVVINLGGMHSPYGKGEEYIELVLINLLKELTKKYNEESILITSGTEANKAIKNSLINHGFNKVVAKTLKQKEFIKNVINCDLFMTSPGMTTIYETCRYNKKTIILPPQNLSQFYNTEYAKKLIKYLKTINWNKEELEFDYLCQYLSLGEEKVVEIIYQNIKKALEDDNYQNKLKTIIKNTLDDEFLDREIIQFKDNGTKQIVDEIIALM